MGPTLCCAMGAFIMAPSMLCHRQAIPSNSSYSARPSLHRRSNTPAVPIQEIGHGLRYYFRSVQRAVPSTGTPYARHKRSPRRRVVGLWACDPRPLCGCSSDSLRAYAAGLMPQHAARMHRSLPRILPWPLLLQTRCSRKQRNYPLITDKFLYREHGTALFPQTYATISAADPQTRISTTAQKNTLLSPHVRIDVASIETQWEAQMKEASGTIRTSI